MPTVNKIDSNITGLSFAEEQTLGTLPGAPVWHAIEPNSYSDLGGDISTVARSPINASRQRQKGTTTDLDAAVGFNHDWLQNGLLRLTQGFFFAAAREKADTKKLSGNPVAVTSTTATTYVAAAGFTFKANDIVLASGFGDAANNGLKVLSAATGTTLTTTGNAIEAAPPAAARIQCVGVEFDADDVDVTLTGTTGVNLVSTVYDFTTLGLTAGEWVYLGGDDAGNSFVNNGGYARVASAPTAHLMTFDDTTWTPQAESGAGASIRLFFGTVLRNEKDPTLIVTKSVQFERTLGSDGLDPDAQSEYVIGSVGNELTLNVPQADKLNVDLTFVGINVEHRTSTEGVKAGTRVVAQAEDAFNTSSDIYRVRMNIVDPTTINNAALFGYVQEGNITISNGVTPNKALGVLGAFDLSAGDFTVGGSVTAYFTTVSAVAAIRNNSDIGFNVICAKQNAGFVFDAPLMSIGGGRLNVEKDAPILIPLENSAFENANGYTLLYTTFAYLPDAAMPD